MASAPPGRARTGLGDVKVVEKVTGYKKIKFFTHENAGYGDVHLPEMQMHTTAFWLTVPHAVIDGLGAPRAEVIDALRGVTSALHTVAAVGLMVDPRDLGRTLGEQTEPSAPPRKDGPLVPGFDPTVFLYDHTPGGVGLAARLFADRGVLLARARRLVAACSCLDGCPACIGPAAGLVAGPAGLAGGPGPGGAPRPVGTVDRKGLAVALLDAMGAAA